MTEEVKKQRAGFLDSIETARSCERYGVGWPDWVETELDALIAAVEREALERAAKVCDDLESKYPYGSDYSHACDKCAYAIRALIESKEG